MRQFVARVGIALVVGTLLIAPSASIPPAAAAACPAVTHGTLAEIVASPGLIVVADVIALRQGDTPAVDQFAVKQVIRPEVPDQGLDLRAGVLTVPSNECWQGLRPGDRIIAIFPSPDTLVAERSVAWRIGAGDRVEQTFEPGRDRGPDERNRPDRDPPASRRRGPGDLDGPPQPRSVVPSRSGGHRGPDAPGDHRRDDVDAPPPGRSQPRNVERRIADRQAAAPTTCGLVLAGRFWRQIGQPVGLFALVAGEISCRAGGSGRPGRFYGTKVRDLPTGCDAQARWLMRHSRLVNSSRRFVLEGWMSLDEGRRPDDSRCLPRRDGGRG